LPDALPIVHLAAALVLLSIPATGQAGGERRIIPTDDGFMEIDTQSGAVTNANEHRTVTAAPRPRAIQARCRPRLIAFARRTPNFAANWRNVHQG
jgi:hypothetical protein